MKKSELKALIKEVIKEGIKEGIKDGTKISDKKFPNIQGTIKNYKKKPFQSNWNVSDTDDVGEEDDELPQQPDRIKEDTISPLEKDEFDDIDDVVEAIIESLEQLRDETYYKGWLTGRETPKEIINVIIKLIKEEWKIR